jgi:hypothetical protein
LLLVEYTLFSSSQNLDHNNLDHNILLEICILMFRYSY